MPRWWVRYFDSYHKSPLFVSGDNTANISPWHECDLSHIDWERAVLLCWQHWFHSLRARHSLFPSVSLIPVSSLWSRGWCDQSSGVIANRSPEWQGVTGGCEGRGVLPWPRRWKIRALETGPCKETRQVNWVNGCWCGICGGWCAELWLGKCKKDILLEHRFFINKQCNFNKTCFTVMDPLLLYSLFLRYFWKSFNTDRLCGLVVRVPGYRSRGPGSIPSATVFSEK
jgi:hypothetical protein